MMFRHQLPPVAAKYVAEFPYDKRKVRHLVGRFHAWLAVDDVDTVDINTDLVDQFLKLPWTRKLAASTRELYDRHLYRYVWYRDSRRIQARVPSTRNYSGFYELRRSPDLPSFE